MKGTLENLTINGYPCSLYLPFGYSTSVTMYPVIYMNGGDDVQIQEIMGMVEPHIGEDIRPFLLLCVKSDNWYDDYSPWYAPPLTKKSDPFGGCAAEYLHILTKSIKPFIDEHYKTKREPENTALIGYSLGGLAALYSLYKCNIFSKVGSLSGSLWFDGWVEFMASNKLLNNGTRIYISLGKEEHRSGNPRMAKAYDCTQNVVSILEGQLASRGALLFELNNGGHFTEIPNRYKQAILWLMKDPE